jgi:hypothetical protein
LSLRYDESVARLVITVTFYRVIAKRIDIAAGRWRVSTAESHSVEARVFNHLSINASSLDAEAHVLVIATSESMGCVSRASIN